MYAKISSTQSEIKPSTESVRRLNESRDEKTY